MKCHYLGCITVVYNVSLPLLYHSCLWNVTTLVVSQSFVKCRYLGCTVSQSFAKFHQLGCNTVVYKMSLPWLYNSRLWNVTTLVVSQSFMKCHYLGCITVVYKMSLPWLYHSCLWNVTTLVVQYHSRLPNFTNLVVSQSSIKCHYLGCTCITVVFEMSLPWLYHSRLCCL